MIQGGVAEADLLGVFGREGVFAATAWPLKSITNGGKSSRTTSSPPTTCTGTTTGTAPSSATRRVNAQTTDVENTSVYAFAHSGDASAVDLVAVNKSSVALPATIEIASAPALTGAKVYDLVDGKVAASWPPVERPRVSCPAGRAA